MSMSSVPWRHIAKPTSAFDVGDLVTWRKKAIVVTESSPGVTKGAIQQ